jgi:ParB family chromosome partitioning protein
MSSILVSARIRKDTGDLTELANDLQKHGLINPITVMDCQNGQYQLIAGLRRMEAAKQIQMPELRATVLSPMQAEEMLAIEIAENEQRLNFTTAERLEYAEKIKAVEQAKARERMSLHARDGYETNQVRDERPYPEKGRARDAIASSVGFSSGRQYERAVAVAKKRPDLLSKIDSGEKSIFGAYQEARGADVKKQADHLEETESPQKSPISTDQIARAGVIRLMKNPHFRDLQDELQNTQAEATAAKTKLKRATEAYDNKVKHFENNISFLSRLVKELKEENAALRERLGMEARHVKRVEFGNPDGIIGIPEDTVS